MPSLAASAWQIAALRTDPAFAKIEQLMQANKVKDAFQELEKLAKAGNAQALYNLGYLTQTGQGTAKNEKESHSVV